MPEDDVRVALVGYGGSGSGIHAPLIDGTPGVAVAAVIAGAAERREAAARRFPDAIVADSIEEARGCHVAVVTLPVQFRGYVTQRLLDLGLRVVLEKPFAADLASARDLSAHVGDRVSVFHNRRWDSDFLTLRQLRQDGAWKGPVRLTSRIQRWQPTVRDGWRNYPESGGYLREVGPHLIDQAIQLLGPVVSVSAEINIRREGAHAEDDVLLSLAHADGDVSHLISGALGNTDLPRFEVSARDVLVSLGNADPQQEQLAAGLSFTDSEWGRPDSTNWFVRSASDKRSSIDAIPGRWPAYYEAVPAWVDGEQPPVLAEDGVATLRVIEAAQRSAREGRRISIEEV